MEATGSTEGQAAAFTTDTRHAVSAAQFPPSVQVHSPRCDTVYLLCQKWKAELLKPVEIEIVFRRTLSARFLSFIADVYN
jgi:hypothetical protein